MNNYRSGNRKTKAMEEAYRKSQDRYIEPKSLKTQCPSFDEVLKDAQRALDVGGCEAYRRSYHRYYINGGKTFDKAMELLNSQLAKALE